MEDTSARSRLPGLTESILEQLESCPTVDHVCTCPLPHRQTVGELLTHIERLLFPGYFGRKNVDKANLRFQLGQTVNDAYDLLQTEITKCVLHSSGRAGDSPGPEEARSEGRRFAQDLLENIPRIIEVLDGDVEAAYLGDPAATGNDEIIIAYPGFQAVLTYRVAHHLHTQGVPLLPRIMTEYAHSATGIDIHPGARIGRNFFIDHGTGVVIGETTEIGDHVKLYQGVTLGALSFPTDEHGNLQRGFKRHPTIEDDVVIYSNASILGAVRIGRGSAIGGNVFLTHDVEPGSKVTIEKPENRIRRRQRAENTPVER
ncbi:MAG: serine O-acetyltransferase EpsC [Spirochaetota bacterium]